jgi:dimethylglycine dehydrogenase
MRGTEVVGTVTSGDWGYRTGLNLAYAFVLPDLAVPGTETTIDILGRMIPAKVIAPSPYDPDFARMRS